MRAEERYYFECLRCGTQADMGELPPRCPSCRSGNGIVTERRLPQAPHGLSDPAGGELRI